MSKLGYHVTLTVTAYIMAEDEHIATARVISGLRKQHKVLLTTIEPTTVTHTDVINDDYIEEDAILKPSIDEPPAAIPIPKPKRRRLCPAHKADLTLDDTCTAGFIGCGFKRLRGELDT